MSEALTLAHELPHRLSLVATYGMATLLYLLQWDEQLTQEKAKATITLATELGFPFWLATGTTCQGWSMTTQGQEEEGITQMRQGITAVQAIGLSRMLRPYWLAVLAEAHMKIGQVEEGLGALAEVFAEVPPNGKFWCEAELYRIKGELTLKQSSV